MTHPRRWTRKRKVAHFTLALAGALVALGCGAPGVAPETSPAPTVERFTYGPFSVVYEISSHSHSEQDFMGQKNSFDVGMRYYVTATANPAGHASQVHLTIDSVPYFTGAPDAGQDAAQQLAGAEFSGILSPEGEIVGFQAPEGDSPLLQQIARAMEHFFPRIPSGGVAPGQTWSDTLSVTTSSSGLDISAETHTDYSARAWGDYQGTRALEVASEASYSVSGGGVQQGAEITLDGSGINHGLLYLASDGRFMGGTSTDSSNMTATVAAMGAMIPITQVRHDTLKVVR